MPDLPPYPIFVNLAQRPVLVVGGGHVGLRKTRSLLEYGAHVTVVSPEFAADFETLSEVECVVARYAAFHMGQKPWRLVFAATDVTAVNGQVHKDADARGIL